MTSNAPKLWSTPALAVVCLVLGVAGWMVGSLHQRAVGTNPSSASSALSSASVSPPSALYTKPVDKAPEPDNAADATAWQSRWQQLLGQASSPARDRALVALLEQLAKTDPQRALALAAAESNWRLRDELRDASLRGWASTDAKSAGDHALTLRIDNRRRAVAAVLEGAASASPDSAVRTALRLCAADPDPAGDYGHATIAALVKNGAFTDAVRFGQELGTEKFPFILKSAYYEWALHQPDAALASVESIRDPVTRSQAASEVYFGWARADAKGLATYALTLPAGDARTRALAEALPQWVEKDPVTAIAWINENDTGGDFDDGAAAVANTQALITRQPAKAMEWAASVNDPKKREQTLRTVFRQWAQKDPVAARRFIDTTPDSPDRNILTSELNDAAPGS